MIVLYYLNSSEIQKYYKKESRFREVYSIDYFSD